MRLSSIARILKRIVSCRVFSLACASVFLLPGRVPGASPSLAQQLEGLPFKIAYESYVGSNWEIFVINADGSGPANLTQTPQEHEHYPQVSADGAHFAYVVDRGEGREAIRSLWIMDLDGKNRKKVADYAREPFWTVSGTLGYLPQEYPKFNVIDYYTSGMTFFDPVTSRTWPHPNSARLRHLYNPSCAPNGKWIAATVHAAMEVGHAILLIESGGSRIINLEIPGCRPCLSPDGRQIAWSSGDHEIAVAPISLDSQEPRVGPWRLRIQDDRLKLIHVDWSPDSRFLCFSRGPDGRGDADKPGTFPAASGVVGAYAAGWNLCVVSAAKEGVLDLNRASDAEAFMVTTNGLSNKEPCWFRVH